MRIAICDQPTKEARSSTVRSLKKLVTFWNRYPTGSLNEYYYPLQCTTRIAQEWTTVLDTPIVLYDFKVQTVWKRLCGTQTEQSDRGRWQKLSNWKMQYSKQIEKQIVRYRCNAIRIKRRENIIQITIRRWRSSVGAKTSFFFVTWRCNKICDSSQL